MRERRINMDKKEKPYHWAKQSTHKDCKIIDCPKHDPYKLFFRDPTGVYVLIKIDFEFYRIELAICNKNHEIVAIFRGQTAQDVYYTILQTEKKSKTEWFKEKTHLAYLGKELKKAELALSMGQNAYFQE